MKTLSKPALAPEIRWTETTPLRVAFTGPAGSGKTTHARAVQKAYGGDVLSFASPLKKIAKDLFGDALDDGNFARRAYQSLGLTVRQLDTNTWVRLLLAKISPDRPTYVDDCRFYNEYLSLKSLGFVFVRMGASMKTLHERRPEMTEAEWLHQSEIESATIPGDLVTTTDYPLEVTTSGLDAMLRGLRPEVFKRKK